MSTGIWRRGYQLSLGSLPALRHQTFSSSAVAEEVRYLPALGVLRVSAACAVVALHAISLWLKGTEPGTAAWWVADFYDAATRWGVPAFIMISGALLLSPHRLQPPGVFFRKRMKKILIPLVFWTVFYLGLRRFSGGLSWPILARDLVRGYPYGHLWYLYVLVGLYGITPLLQPFVQSASRRTLTGAVVALLAAVSMHSLISSFTAGYGKPTIFSMFVAFIPYYLCGYLLSLVVVPRRWIRYLIPGVLAVWLGIALGTGLFFQRLEFYLSTHHSVLIILLSAGVFLLASGLFGPQGGDRARPWEVLRYLDRLSFGVYLVHPLPLFVAMRLGLPTKDMLQQPLLWIPVISSVLLCASLLLTAGLKVIPALRHTV